MYVVVYYIVFAMGNESTIVNSKKIQILYYCLSLQCMTQQSIWFDHQEVRLTYKSPWLSRLERHSSKPEVVGSNPAVGKNFSFCNSRSLHVADTSNQSIQMKSTVAYT